LRGVNSAGSKLFFDILRDFKVDRHSCCSSSLDVAQNAATKNFDGNFA
jgi:hypothetical protein